MIADKTSTKMQSEGTKAAIRRFLVDSSVPLLFIAVCLIGVYYSKLPAFFIMDELVARVMRNSFLVLALIIPVIAGLGLNFGLVIGAMAGQFALIAVKHWEIGGFPGFLVSIAVSTPLAILFGWLTALLLNKTKGQEMISSMIAGFFSNGVYQFILLFMVGTIIPLKNKVLVLEKGFGVTNTIDLSRNGNLTYSLDNLLKLPFFQVLAGAAALGAIGLVLYYVYQQQREKRIKSGSLINKGKEFNRIRWGGWLALCVGLFILGIAVLNSSSMIKNVRLPVATTIAIVGLCLFNSLIVKTKLGQDFRSVGQDIHIAKISGINVDRMRIIAMIISTILAAWGQIIFLQNIGTMATYGSHVQIATFSIAAILLGGASVTKATNGQAILGVILFHALFIVSPKAGNNIFGEAQIGEFFRAFVAYGVIGVALGLHAWKKTMQSRKKDGAAS